jgi:hypothetical protein
MILGTSNPITRQLLNNFPVAINDQCARLCLFPDSALPAVVCCQSPNGLAARPLLMVKRGTGSTGSDVSGELSNADFLVEDLVARPVVGGEDGVNEVLTGVTKGSSSNSGANSVISLSCA